MGKQYIIDSNSVIDYLSGNLPKKGMVFMNQIINDIPMISVITKIEVLGYKTNEAANRLLVGFVDDSVVLGLTDDVVEQTIEIRKEHKIKTPDAIIAATAMVNGFAVITRNTKDFDNLPGLEVINPHGV